VRTSFVSHASLLLALPWMDKQTVPRVAQFYVFAEARNV
jgi:hypothetical protein